MHTAMPLDKAWGKMVVFGRQLILIAKKRERMKKEYMHKLSVFLNILVLALSGLLFLCAGACASEENPMEVRLAQTACGRSTEYVMDLSDGWRFGGKGEDAVYAAVRAAGEPARREQRTEGRRKEP